MVSPSLRNLAYGAASALAMGMFAPKLALANPLDTYGFGLRSLSLAGAVGADVEDFSANYYNPAGLARADGLSISVGYFDAHHELRLNGLDNNVDDVRGLVFGLSAPGKLGEVPFAFGFACHLNDERVARTRSLPEAQPRWEMYDNRTHRIFIAANLALEPLPWLTLGGGISFMSATSTELDVGGTIDFLAPESKSDLRSTLRGTLASIRYPQAGMQVRPIEGLAFGVTYRGEFRLTLELNAEIKGNIAVGDLDIPAYFALISNSVNAFLPQQLAFSASYRPVPSLRIGVDATWINWAAYQSSVSATEIILQIDVPEAFKDQIKVPDNVGGSVPRAPHFVDRIVPRIGLEWTAISGTAADLDLRLGYFFEKSPVPEQRGATNFVDSDRHALSVGIGTTLKDLRPTIPGRLVINGGFQWSYIVPRVMEKAIVVDRIGDYEASGNIFTGGVDVGVVFQ